MPWISIQKEFLQGLREGPALFFEPLMRLRTFLLKRLCSN